jgi:hypothetical protein
MQPLYSLRQILQTSTLAHFALVTSAVVLGTACGSEPDPVDARWEPAFDTSATGTLSAVWGSGPNDVFIVGGTTEQGEIYHYDGVDWSPMQVPEDVPLLVWVHGFGPELVYAVGLDGSVVRYDGNAWSSLDSGTEEDLWGVFGFASDDLWIVGGDASTEDPVILHYDGSSFSAYELPEEENRRRASSIFKVWGIDGFIAAVGERGLILELRDGEWRSVSTDTSEAFVSLWGTSAENIVAAGSNVSGQIAHYDGDEWRVTRFPTESGLNGVFMDDPTHAVVSGWDGFLGRYEVESGELIFEAETAQLLRMHSVWGDGEGRYYAVGGNFFSPHRGEAYVRVTE